MQPCSPQSHASGTCNSGVHHSVTFLQTSVTSSETLSHPVSCIERKPVAENKMQIQEWWLFTVLSLTLEQCALS